MGALRPEKTTRLAFIANRRLHILLLCIGSAICVSLLLIFNYPTPEDPHIYSRFAKSSTKLVDREHVFAVMDQDVSAIELIIHDYIEDEGIDKTYNIYISSGTVADALEKAGIELKEFDEISIDNNAQIHNGMEVIITRVHVEQTYEYESYPYEVVRQASASLPANVEKVIQDGVDGERCYLYDTVYKNGELYEQNLVSTNIIKKPINEIVAYGTTSYYRPDSSYTLSEEDKSILLSDGIVLHYNDVIEVNATAYTTEGQRNKITKSGAKARYGIIAVDPKVIPLGTELFVIAKDGSWVYGYAIAGDTGGFIKGNRVDLFYDTKKECISFGRQDAYVYVLTDNEL